MTTETFAIHHSHGQTEDGIDSYDEALDRVRAVYGAGCSIGHDGDIAQGGERTLVWVDEETGRNDDGSRACCSIRRRHAVYLYEIGSEGEPEAIAPAPLALASKALLAAGWDTSSEDDKRIILGVDAEDGEGQLAEVRAIVVPLGCDAEWAGTGNTAGDGLTTEDVIVTAREAE